MAKTKLTDKEKSALLVVIAAELKTLFEELDTGLKDYDTVSQSILTNLDYLIKKGLKIDPEKTEVYDIFKP